MHPILRALVLVVVIRSAAACQPAALAPTRSTLTCDLLNVEIGDHTISQCWTLTATDPGEIVAVCDELHGIVSTDPCRWAGSYGVCRAIRLGTVDAEVRLFRDDLITTGAAAEEVCQHLAGVYEKTPPPDTGGTLLKGSSGDGQCYQFDPATILEGCEPRPQTSLPHENCGGCDQPGTTCFYPHTTCACTDDGLLCTSL